MTERIKFQELVQIVATLRGPEGCPWDKKQTHQSLKPFLLEEAYEVLEVLDGAHPDKLKEELGDLFFQVLLHARLAEEAGEFSIEDVIQAVGEKMKRRHPHVFGDLDLNTPQEVLANWEQIKQAERGCSKTSALDGVPRQLPSLMRAHRLQEKAARLGFDHPGAKEAFAKLEEEIREFKQACRDGDGEKIEEELGDLFFSLVNVARFVEVNPEEALHKTIVKFIKRFRYIEESMARQGRSLGQADLAQMDALWEQAKSVSDLP